MIRNLEEVLFETGRGHALSAERLHDAAILYAEEHDLDLEIFPFNGTFSLSIHYLLGLGLELMLKSAIVAWGGRSDDKYLRNTIGHDLTAALHAAEAAGFKSQAPHLHEIIAILSGPFKMHWFRYGRPDKFVLPGNFSQVIDTVAILDAELQDRIWKDHLSNGGVSQLTAATSLKPVA